MPDYTRNHYVPEWYQNKFIPKEIVDKKFYYLDLYPDFCSQNGHTFQRKSLMRWGPQSCFYEDRLYSTRFGSIESTEIEEKFFGRIDTEGKSALEYFENFTHPGAHPGMLHKFLNYLSVQKLRTPKGLAFLQHLQQAKSKNEVLFYMQKIQNIYCALWAECIWSIVDASDSYTKFVLSDHPVTVYNKGYFPGSKQCTTFGDPEVWHTGTHTLFPLSLDKMLILTNLSWLRNPYGNPRVNRPNPHPFRDTIFNFLQIQLGRKLDEAEVQEINFIIKSRSKRYIASFNKDSLFPENQISSTKWDTFGNKYLLMPDPRNVPFTSESVIGYSSGHSEWFDAYGRKPWQKSYTDPKEHRNDWDTSMHFQGEFAKRFGPKRRGVSYELGRTDHKEDSDEFHAYHLSLIEKYPIKKSKYHYF